MEQALASFDIIKYLNLSTVPDLNEVFNNKKLDEYFENKAAERIIVQDFLSATEGKHFVDYCFGATETIIALKKGWVTKLIVHQNIEGSICTIKDIKTNSDIAVYISKNKEIDKKMVASCMDVKQWIYHNYCRIESNIEVGFYSSQFKEATTLLKSYGTICAILHHANEYEFQKQIQEVDHISELFIIN